MVYRSSTTIWLCSVFFILLSFVYGQELTVDAGAVTSNAVAPHDISTMGLAIPLVIPPGSSATTTPPSDFLFLSPSIIAEAFPGPSTTQPEVGLATPTSFNTDTTPIISTSSSTDTISTPLIQSITISDSLTTPSLEPTVTTSMPLSITSPVAATSTSTSPPLDLATQLPSTSPGMSTAQQAGMGAGITLGILSIAGTASFCLWCRKRNHTLKRDSFPSMNSPRFPGSRLGDLFRLHSRATSDINARTDAEWSIESAEKVEIMRRRPGSVRSVRTVSCPSRLNNVKSINKNTKKNSRLISNVSAQGFSNTLSATPKPKPPPLPKLASPVLGRVGGGKGDMPVPERQPRVPAALMSNPISPISSTKEDVTWTWPLPE